MASLKKVTDNDADWETINDILRWVVDTEKGTLFLSPKLKADIIFLVDTLPMRLCMVVKLLERLIGKIWSLHLAVTGDIGKFYTMQVALTCAWSTNCAT